MQLISDTGSEQLVIGNLLTGILCCRMVYASTKEIKRKSILFDDKVF